VLTQLGVPLGLPVSVDETPRAGESAADLVCRLAAQKARAGMVIRPARIAPVMAADTAVALGNELFGKPADQSDAARMLARLAGRTHAVWTAVAVTDGMRERVELSHSEVTFRAITPRRSRGTGNW
jgi:septum formation protein